MIKGFEKETKPLTDFEQSKVLPRVIEGFHRIAGTKYRVTNKYIIGKLALDGIEVSEARIRKVINHIRTNFLVIGLCANSKGYWVERDPEKIMKYIKSLDSRIASTQAMRDKLWMQYTRMNQPKITFHKNHYEHN